MIADVAVLGAGPAGIEAALYAYKLGLSVVLLEAGERPGTNIERWGFVRLFTPWKLLVSPLGQSILRRRGLAAPEPESFPTGREYIATYLAPLADELGDSLRIRSAVVGVGRVGLLKMENIGGRRRREAPFRILVRSASGEDEVRARAVIDATGVFATPNALGDGGVAARGEQANADRIEYHVADLRGEDRARFANRSTLLVGSGYSAATMLVDLIDLRDSAGETSVIWARRSSGPAPFPLYENDPLPERDALGRRANIVAADPPEGCRVLPGVAVEEVARTEDDRLAVSLVPVDGGGAPETVVVDRILANVGYHPNVDLFRELQVHQCYASEGPMNLAAALFAAAGGSSDCLSQRGHGSDALRNPEPNFFIIGQKSYGRRNDYLLQVAWEQIRDVFRCLRDDPELDLYRSQETTPS